MEHRFDPKGNVATSTTAGLSYREITMTSDRDYSMSILWVRWEPGFQETATLVEGPKEHGQKS